MAHSVRDQRDSPSNRLRRNLDDAERELLSLRPEQVANYLLRLDEIEEQFLTLEAGGLDLRGERTRQESLVSRLESEPALITRPATQVGGLAALRQQHPPASGPWWHVDVIEAQRRRILIRRLVTSLTVLVGLILAAWITITYIFPPDPNAVLSSGATGQLPDLVARGEWEAADTLIAETLAQLTEDDVELLIWQAVVAEELGRTEESQEAMAKAKELAANNLAAFWATVGNVYLTAGKLDQALAAADEATAIDPNEAQAYFVRASVAEIRGEVPVALENFERAFDLAAESNPQLAVIARVRMGMLLQSAPPISPITTTAPAGP